MSQARKGIVLAGGSGTRLYPATIPVSKQLLPVYDKPLIYYPLSVLMLAGIRRILIITTPDDLPLFERLLGDGSQFGIELSLAAQQRPEGLPQAYLIAKDFLGDAPSALILGDNIFYGHELPRILQSASGEEHGGTIFSYHVSNPQDYGVLEFDATGRAIAVEEKPAKPRSNYAVTGLYFFDSRAVQRAHLLRPSKRGELEITDLIRLYLEAGELAVKDLGRGTTWLDTGEPGNLLHAGNFVETIQNRQGLKIACLEEIAYRQGWLAPEGVRSQAERMNGSAYGAYLRTLIQ